MIVKLDEKFWDKGPELSIIEKNPKPYVMTTNSRGEAVTWYYAPSDRHSSEAERYPTEREYEIVYNENDTPTRLNDTGGAILGNRDREIEELREQQYVLRRAGRERELTVTESNRLYTIEVELSRAQEVRETSDTYETEDVLPF